MSEGCYDDLLKENQGLKESIKKYRRVDRLLDFTDLDKINTIINLEKKIADQAEVIRILQAWKIDAINNNQDAHTLRQRVRKLERSRHSLFDLIEAIKSRHAEEIQTWRMYVQNIDGIRLDQEKEIFYVEKCLRDREVKHECSNRNHLK